ncbi:hypothetical protein M9H77_06869 [Catharanthus roseus]|uniref:Uncharacterized protein n=1 Tax=Catharanthus roseus TaxID=4058 RepID=A0ACC0BTB5_CATRO|nr:hypothetical protein M9H77_06869 [Catharanthus roseus]
MVTLKNSHIVKPAESTPNEIMYLSHCDQLKPITHAPTIYFYKPTKESLENALHILKNALSKALVIFYPLAGRLKWVSGGRVELHCNSTGALLLEAQSELKIDHFGDFRPNLEITKYLLPSVDLSVPPIEEVPLLLAQLTKFACGGFSLGLKVSHVILDGQSALHFVSEWAKIARGEKFTESPYLDRSVLQPKELQLTADLPKSKYSQLDPPSLMVGKSDNLEERNKPTKVTMLKLSEEQINELKKRANYHGSFSSRPCSRFEALCAHIWRCATKVRRHAMEQETICYVSVDFRQRVKPPLPPKYFGNAVMLTPAVAIVGDLISEPFGYAAGKIRESIEFVTNEYVNSYLVRIKNLSDVSPYRHFHTAGCSRGAFLGNPNLVVTSWIGLPLYGADFGWGKEIYMGPATLGYDGKAFFIPSKDGDGSLSIPFCFQLEHLDDFEKYFYEEI